MGVDREGLRCGVALTVGFFLNIMSTNKVIYSSKWQVKCKLDDANTQPEDGLVWFTELNVRGEKKYLTRSGFSTPQQQSPAVPAPKSPKSSTLSQPCSNDAE